MVPVLNVTADTGDVEELMQAVSQALQDLGPRERSLSGTPLSQKASADMLRQAALLMYQWNVDSRAIIHSTRRGAGPWLIRFQIVVRRLTWWFLDPLVQQIRLFQRNTARVVDAMARSHDGLARETALNGDETALRLAALEARVAELERQLEYREHSERHQP